MSEVFLAAMLLPLTLVLALVVVAQVPQRDKTCQSSEECLPLNDCPYWQEKEDIKNSLSRGRERQAIVNQQKNQICNKGARALCCPPCKESEPCLPVAQCPAVQQLQAQRKDYKRKRNNAAAQQLLAQIQGLICNTKEKLLCCPPTKESLLPNLREQCGTQPNLRGASVVGGKNSEIGEFPWAALLGNYRTTKRRINGRTHTVNQTRWSCGGILITRRFVLTAAHCQGRKESTRLATVRLGEYSVEGYGGEPTGGQLPPEQNFDIGPNDVMVHEDYQTKVQGKFRNILNDIALIRLPTEARLNNGVQLVCLPKWPAEYRPELEVDNIMKDLEGRRPTVVGWGYTSGFDPWSGDLQGDTEKYGVGSRIQQKLALPLLDPKVCTQKYDGFQPEESQICAGGERGKDSCKGDSGGGLYIQRPASNTRPWYLIGIVSFGSKSCGSGRPGVYTRVSEFIPWIEEEMGKL